MLNLKDVVVHYGGIEALQDKYYYPHWFQWRWQKHLFKIYFRFGAAYFR
jgi:hypothetical protein